MNYRGLLLDLDDTLYNYELSHRKGLDAALQYVSEISNKNRGEIDPLFLKAKESIHMELKGTAASHNRTLYFQRMFEYLQENACLHTLQTYELYWQTFLDSMELYEGALSFLERHQDVPICLVTDLTAQIQHRKLKKLGIQNYINFMVSSEEAGTEKPHPYIFMKALNKLGIGVRDVIMIGDHYKKDIMGASSLGIQSYWLNHHQAAAHRPIEHVIMVPDFLILEERLLHE